MKARLSSVVRRVKSMRGKFQLWQNTIGNKEIKPPKKVNSVSDVKMSVLLKKRGKLFQYLCRFWCEINLSSASLQEDVQAYIIIDIFIQTMLKTAFKKSLKILFFKTLISAVFFSNIHSFVKFMLNKFQ